MTARLTLGAVVLFASSLAFAQEGAKVDVQAQVVHALEGGNQVAPPSLKAMQSALAPKKKYGSLKQLSVTKVQLSKAPVVVSLPNEKKATLSLESLKDDVATVRVKLPPLDATYKLGRERNLYLQAGVHLGGDLWLVLAPAP